MVKCLAFGLLALVSAASALQIKFHRFSNSGCYEEHHIEKDTHLDDGKCKTFSHKEPLFYSFMFYAEKDANDLADKYCLATVHREENCAGVGFNYGDMLPQQDRCANNDIGGRSVYISCDVRANKEVVDSAVADVMETAKGMSATSMVTVEEAVPTPKTHTIVKTIIDPSSETTPTPSTTLVTTTPAVAHSTTTVILNALSK